MQAEFEYILNLQQKMLQIGHADNQTYKQWVIVVFGSILASGTRLGRRLVFCMWLL